MSFSLSVAINNFKDDYKNELPSWDCANSMISKYERSFFHEIVSSDLSLKKITNEHEYSNQKFNQQLKNASLFCQRSILKAMDENRDLNPNEIAAIKDKFNSMSAPLDRNNQPQISLINDLNTIKQITPLIIKISEVFVKVIYGFEIKLKENLSQNKLNAPIQKPSKKYTNIILNSSKLLFPEELCTRKNLLDLKNAQKEPNFEEKSLSDSLKASAIFFTHLALKKENIDGEMIENIFTKLIEKMKVIQTGEKLSLKVNDLNAKIAKEKEQILVLKEECLELKKSLNASQKEFEALKGRVSKATMESYEEEHNKIMNLIKNAKSTQEQYYVKSNQLNGCEEKLTKKIEALNAKKIECDLYFTQQGLTNEIIKKDRKKVAIENFNILKGKPEIVAYAYSLFASYLEARVQRQPEQKRWFGSWW